MSYSCIDHGATACDGCMNPNHKQTSFSGAFDEYIRANSRDHKRISSGRKELKPLRLAHWKRGRKKLEAKSE